MHLYVQDPLRQPTETGLSPPKQPMIGGGGGVSVFCVSKETCNSSSEGILNVMSVGGKGMQMWKPPVAAVRERP